ncbi:MAG TPA: leucine-rich repeat domain-containing protein [Chitinophagaceae bacterium]
MSAVTEKQIENGFWLWDKANGFSPDSITYPTQFSGQTKLNIACTQCSDLTPAQQKNLIKEWASFLPNCKSIELLWFTTTTPQTIFDSVCLIDGLVGLNIKNSNIKSLDSLSNLKKLKYLRIGNSPKIESIEPLKTLANLEVLVIENFKNISDFSVLKLLTNLKSLTIEGGMYKKQKIDSFDFLADLKDLIYLSTTMISSMSTSIDTICKLKNLKTLNWAFDLTKSEIEKLNQELSNLKYLPHRHVESNLIKIKSTDK